MDKRDISRLGKAGELVVLNHFSKTGSIVESSVNQFDSKKDMYINGKSAEVKTQVPFMTKNAFSIRKAQLKKCLSVDQLFFVSVPGTGKDGVHFSSGKVYKADPKKIKYEIHKTKDGREMVLFPIVQDALIEEFTMSENDCKILQSYSVSNWD